MEETVDHKVCFLCKESKSVNLFRKDPQKRDGYTSRCKACINKPAIIIDHSKIKEKICVDCKINKNYSEYHKNTKRGRTTVQSRCKPCMAEYKKKRYWSNHEVELMKLTESRNKPENVIQRKTYYVKNKSSYQERHKRYWSDEEKRKHKLEISRQSYIKHRDKVRARHRKNGQRPEVKERLKEKHKILTATNPQYVIKRRLRFRLRHIIRALGSDKYKTKSSMELLGCELPFFKKYIESKFKDGMCWERLSEIHLDHIKPCSRFDLTKEEEQKVCFHYTNIQPLWWRDNLSKGNRYIEQKAA